jgi:hypothetical protein
MVKEERKKNKHMRQKHRQIMRKTQTKTKLQIRMTPEEPYVAMRAGEGWRENKHKKRTPGHLIKAVPVHLRPLLTN